MSARAFILWAFRRSYRGKSTSRWSRVPVVTFDDRPLFVRFAPFWFDESVHDGTHYNRPPWWRPFNVLLHWWRPKSGVEEFHDHPRWSVTVCLRGEIVEMTPWGERTLKPGSVVVRSRKAIHAFRVPGRSAWTLFIVGRRNHPQNTYAITPQGFA